MFMINYRLVCITPCLDHACAVLRLLYSHVVFFLQYNMSLTMDRFYNIGIAAYTKSLFKEHRLKGSYAYLNFTFGGENYWNLLSFRKTTIKSLLSIEVKCIALNFFAEWHITCFIWQHCLRKQLDHRLIHLLLAWFFQHNLEMLR